MASSKPIYLPKAPYSSAITKGVRVSAFEFGGGTQLQGFGGSKPNTFSTRIPAIVYQLVRSLLPVCPVD